MAANRVAKPSQRQADYSNIGYAGRKTGVVLRDTGVRDEHGMPTLDDLFSSPQRVPSPSKGYSHLDGALNATTVEQLGRVATGSPPAQYSSPRKSIPPRARSPIKTSIGSPRKSLNGSPAKTGALLASPVRMGQRGQAGTGEEVADADFENSRHKRRSLEQAPKRMSLQPSVNGMSKPILQPPRRGLFEIPSSPAVNQAGLKRKDGQSAYTAGAVQQHLSSPRRNDRTHVGSKPAVPPVVLPRVNGYAESPGGEAELFVRQDATSPMIVNNNPTMLPVNAGKTTDHKQGVKAKNKRSLDEIEAEERRKRVKRKSPPPIPPPVEVDEQSDNDVGGFGDDYNDAFEADDQQHAVADLEMEREEVEEADTLPIEQSRRPQAFLEARSSSPQVLPQKRQQKRPSAEDEQQEAAGGQPAKKLRRSPAKTMLPPPRPQPKLNTAKQPKERDANIAMMFGKADKKHSAAAVPQVAALLPPPLGKSRPKARGLRIVRDEIEADIDGARYTRSGRTSVKPVQYWRGERVIYTEPKREGGRVSLPGIKEVIRVEDEPPLARSKAKKRKNNNIRQREQSIESEEDMPEQAWEIEPGVFAGEVPSWDPVEQRGDPEYPEQVDIAIAPQGLDTLPREVKGADFQVAKTITLPFFHSGMVDLPPGGEKMTKCSRRNHIVFWIFSGRVTVDVSDNQFSLGKGGMWQVPRGNFYSISNPYDRPARIFFAQGCYMTEQEGYAIEDAAELNAPQE